MPLNGSGLAYRLLKLKAVGWLVLGARTRAGAAFDRMLAAWPKDAYALSSRAHLRAQGGDRPGAIDDAQKLVAAHPRRSAADWFNLGFLLDDAARSEMLHTSDRNQTPEAWAGRARTRFEGRAHPVEIAAAAIDMIGPDVSGAYLEPLEQLDLRRIVARVPEFRISEPAREFASRVAEANRARILSHLTRTMDP